MTKENELISKKIGSRRDEKISYAISFEKAQSEYDNAYDARYDCDDENDCYEEEKEVEIL